MKRIFLLPLLFLAAFAAHSQDKQDSLVYHMPIVDGKLVYADTISVPGRTKSLLDSAAKKWLNSYFTFHRPDTLRADLDSSSSVLSQGLLQFNIAPTSMSLVKYEFYLSFCIKINCSNDKYICRIFNVFFVPKSRLSRAIVVHLESPEYLIDSYKKEHMGLAPTVNFGRKKMAEYLEDTDRLIRQAIASLNAAMSGK
jgi:hypothetical protein